MKITTDPRCEICGAPATKITDGHSFCGNPTHRHERLTPDIPIARCALCGYPATRQVDGIDLCRDHEPRHLAATPITPVQAP